MLNSNEIETALHAALNPALLETHEQLEKAAHAWSQAEILGIDTEFLRERTYWAELGLVQVSDGQQAWLVDVIKIDDLTPLKSMFENQAILKVFHSSSEDFEVLWHALQVSPQPVADTQVACAMTGQPLQMSYHSAIKWLTGIEVDKDQTRSNWLRRPLSSRQLHYAATDVVFLPALVNQVRSTLLGQNKWQWLEEDVARAIAQSRESLQPQDAYLRLGGAASLGAGQLQVLRALAAWREQEATSRNLARGFVITDAELILLSRQLPESLEQLNEIEGLHERTLKRHGDALLAAVQAGLKSTEPVEAIQALDKSQKRIIGDMRNLVLVEAEAHGVDPALLASRKVLESLLRAVENGTDIPERLSGWRYRVITEKLINLIQQSG
ncbi:MAG: ribonuclease D [Xanthomonadales bacterium]|nr:ribonuclease D [Xanthomonadales bacterium]